MITSILWLVMALAPLRGNWNIVAVAPPNKYVQWMAST